MNKCYTRVLLASLGLFTLASCVDENYDLANIDKTVQVNVDNLVVPLKLDEIVLKNVLDLKDGDPIKIVNGEYAVVEEGEFSSGDIKIDPIAFSAPSLPSTVTTVNVNGGGVPISAIPVNEISLTVKTEPSAFKVEATKINDAIRSVDRLGVSCNFAIVLSIPELSGVLTKYSISQLELLMPTGLEVLSPKGVYDPQTGLFTAQSLQSNGNAVTVPIIINGIKSGSSVFTFDAVGRTACFKGEMAVKQATIKLAKADAVNQSAALPSTLTIKTDYSMSPIEVKDFTGRIKYDLAVNNMNDIDLSGMPDVLTQPETNITIGNPQIYLNITNPMASYGLSARTGLTITAVRPGEAGKTFSLDAPGYLTIPAKGESNFCISPKMPPSLYPGFDGATHVSFSTLGGILAGNGLPKALNIKLTDPSIPEQQVTNLALGTNIGSATGHYTFFAPVTIGDGSSIVYSDKMDGWNSSKLNDLTVKKVTVTANVTTNIPLGVSFTGQLINKDGKPTGGDVTGAVIPAMAQNAPVTITISGPVTDLDGISFKAIAKGSATDKALTPEMNVKLSNVRVCVDGYYTTTL